jgi:hypothetical protein
VPVLKPPLVKGGFRGIYNGTKREDPMRGRLDWHNVSNN